jgi:hypothetical protein
MKKIAIVVALFGLIGCDSKPKKRIELYSPKAPYEIQKHFSHKVKWDAVKQERWVNGHLWVDSAGGWKCIIIHHGKVEPPSHAITVNVKPK